MPQLRAKKPEAVKNIRFKAVLYADKGAGKTHFCCSIPHSYYIDTEKLQDYDKFVDMIISNQGDIVYLTELQEIITEVKTLMSVKHHYKTLIIDSITFPAMWLAQMEAERIIKNSKNPELSLSFSPQLQKVKRLTNTLAMMLMRLDMNVILCAHEKQKYQKGEQIGVEAEVSEKMAYALGTVLNLRLIAGKRKLYVDKSRYKFLDQKYIN